MNRIGAEHDACLWFWTDETQLQKMGTYDQKGLDERLETVMHTLRQSLFGAAAFAAALIIAGTAPVYGAVGRAADTGTADVKPADKKPADAASAKSSFDEAIDSLYEQSQSITDEEILERTRGIKSDESKLYSGLGEDKGAAAAAALSAYEESKVAYMSARINGDDKDQQQSSEIQQFEAAGADAAEKALREWDLQSEYAQMLIGEGSAVREMIPRYKVTGCTLQDNLLTLDVEEWMTQGYGAPDESGDVSASSYSYDFSLSFGRADEDSAWIPCAINGTDVNFTWLREEADPEKLTPEAPETPFAVQSDADARIVSYARIAAAGRDAEAADGSDPGAEAGERLVFAVNEEAAAVPAQADTEYTRILNAGEDAGADAQVTVAALPAYTYTASKAIAYADTYWKNYNRNYKEYRGVDCANFVSQCLYAGGMPRTDDWYPQSVNWINVMGHIRHFSAYGTFLTAQNANVRAGNPVYYDWNGDRTYDHTAICVGTNAAGLPVVDGHTSNVYHAAWSMGSRGKRGTIVLRTSYAPAAPAVPKNTWKTVSGKVYYLGADGKPVKSSFRRINGALYYFNAKGVRVTGSFKVGGNRYYANPSNGALVTGWKKLSGKWYYYQPSNGARLKKGKYKIGSAWYIIGSSGYRKTGFVKYGGKYYYADKSSGALVSGWKKISGKWYYFDKSTLVRAKGWKTIDGRKCYFNSKGVLKKGKHG